jgi:hypothetical protein
VCSLDLKIRTRILGVSGRCWDVDSSSIGQLDSSHGRDLFQGLGVRELLDELDIVTLDVAHDSDLRSEDWVGQLERQVLRMARSVMLWCCCSMVMRRVWVGLSIQRHNLYTLLNTLESACSRQSCFAKCGGARRRATLQVRSKPSR